MCIVNYKHVTGSFLLCCWLMQKLQKNWNFLTYLLTRPLMIYLMSKIEVQLLSYLSTRVVSVKTFPCDIIYKHWTIQPYSYLQIMSDLWDEDVQDFHYIKVFEKVDDLMKSVYCYWRDVTGRCAAYGGDYFYTSFIACQLSHLYTSLLHARNTLNHCPI